jgi:hypothetical protein
LSNVNHSANRCQTEPATLEEKIVDPSSEPPTEAASVQVREAGQAGDSLARLTASSSWSLAFEEEFGA